jgi:hypothetical protein
MLECVECGRTAGSFELGWSAVRVVDPDVEGEPEIVIYCAQCFAGEFGGLSMWLEPAVDPPPR